MIKRFEEFIEEGFMTRSLDRKKSGEERLENKLGIKEVCKMVSKIISEHLNIPYSDDICTCDGSEEKIIGGNSYKLQFKFKKWDFTYRVSVPENPSSVGEAIISVSTSLSIGLVYHKELTRPVKKILEYVSDELKKILREKYIKDNSNND